MPNVFTLSATTVSLLAIGIGGAGAAPKVVASIKPIHSLVAAVMEGVGAPTLIVDGAGSPHTYAMKPSQASDLSQADIVFWAGDGLEGFLIKPIETLGAKARSVELIDTPDLERLKYREGGPFEEDAHEGEGEVEKAGHHDAAATEDAPGAKTAHDDAGAHAEPGHDAHGGYDMHFWLDPLNAKAMGHEIEKTLVDADPSNAATYKANAEKLDSKLDALIERTQRDLAAVKDKRFVVFHDAYQYYEHRFDIRAAGSITVSPESLPGVQRISEIQKKVRELGATCVFAEPQFEPRLVDVVIEGTQARVGVLDPEGAGLTNGPNLYFELVDGLTSSLKACLSQGS